MEKKNNAMKTVLECLKYNAKLIKKGDVGYDKTWDNVEALVSLLEKNKESTVHDDVNALIICMTTIAADYNLSLKKILFSVKINYEAHIKEKKEW